ncbi:MAG: hypothetical protein KA327_08050 [Pseudarcicella sp.]|nr:hypothetical protein [Pseudarcicella sp.]
MALSTDAKTNFLPSKGISWSISEVRQAVRSISSNKNDKAGRFLFICFLG